MDPTLLVGRTLEDGRYRLDRFIARGAHGAVFAATQTKVGRTVAIKINLQSRPVNLRRFAREAQVLSELQHPNIVGLIDYGEHDDPTFGRLLYMVQPFVEGVSLEAALAARPRWTPEDAVDVACQVLDALEEAHHAEVVHRDVKPGNLMLVDRRGRLHVQVLDFGISKLVADESDGPVDTKTQQPIGTPAYMAPEQWAAGQISASTDLYAVGVMLYRLLAGAAPFAPGPWPVMMRAHCDAPVPPLPPDAPGRFDEVIARAMAKAPADRYRSAAEMRQALRAALAEARTDTGSGRRWPLVAAVAVLVAGAAAAAIGLSGRAVEAPGPDAFRIVIGPPEAGPAPIDAAPEAAPVDAAAPDAAAPDANRPPPARRRRRKPPPGPTPASVAAAFDAALSACECGGARRHLEALRALDAPRAAIKARRYEEECQMMLPDNCRSR